MGAQHQTPGKQSAAQVASTAANDQTRATPGKTTLVQSSYGQAPSVRRGDNFLSSSGRAILAAEYVGRVNAAHNAYLSALTDLRIDKVTQKEEEFPIWASILFAAGGKAVESTLMAACSLLRHGGEAVRELASAGVHGVEAGKVEEKILGLSEKSVEVVVAQATDVAKEKLKAPAVAALGAEGGTEKSQALSFIDYMKDASMELFERFREEPIDRASDAQLLSLFTAFAGARHTPTLYRRNASEHLERYMKSHAKEIGHQSEFGVGKKTGRMVSTRTETRVAWISDGKNPPRLGYVRQEFEDGIDEIDPSVSPAAADAKENAVGMNEDGKVEFLGYVEPELEDIAKQTHEQKWLQSPRVYQIHYPSMDLTR